MANECQAAEAAWIWCDDFDQDRIASYFEYSSASGSFVRTQGVGVDASFGMRTQFAQGQDDAGALRLAFGRTPSSYVAPVDAGTQDYRELYWRIFLRNQAGWTGGGAEKLTRATSLVTGNWAQAMIAHVWSGQNLPERDRLILDPASGTDAAGNLQTTTYNDFGNLRWLGADIGDTALFATAGVGQWYCIEAHVKLNDAGSSNGVFELWIDDVLDAQRTGLNWVGAYAAYGMNAVFVENFWNVGSPAQQERYIDNFIVSTERIGCGI